MTTFNIMHLTKNLRSINSYVDSKYLDIKSKNNLIKKAKTNSLFTFNLDKSKLDLTGKIFILKEFITPTWVSEINSISKKAISFKNSKYRCLILIKIKNDTYAVSYNNGDMLIKNDCIDQNFGYHLSRIILNNDELKSLNVFYPIKNIPIKTSKTTFGRNNIPSSEQYENDDIFLVNLVKGKAKFGDYEDINISGSDSIRLSGKLSLNNDLINILNILNDVLNSESTEQNFENEINIIKKNSEKHKLNKLLKEKLCSLKKQFDKKQELNYGSFRNLEFIDIDYDYARLYTISRIHIDKKRKFTNLSEVERWERIIYSLNNLSKSLNLLDFIKSLTLNVYNIDGELIKKTKLINYLYFNVKQGDTYYFFSEGNWYSMNIDLTKKIIHSINDIKRFDDKDHIFPDYIRSLNKSENDYNNYVAKNSNKNVYLLDKSLFKPKGDFEHYNNRGSIEICDLLENKDDIINLFCIKATTHSSGFSHLISQAYSAAKYISNTDNNSIMEHIGSLINMDSNELKEKQFNLVLGIITNHDNSLDKKNSEIFPIVSMISLQRLKNFCLNKGIGLEILFIKKH